MSEENRLLIVSSATTQHISSLRFHVLFFVTRFRGERGLHRGKELLRDKVIGALPRRFFTWVLFSAEL